MRGLSKVYEDASAIRTRLARLNSMDRLDEKVYKDLFTILVDFLSYLEKLPEEHFD